uniref:TLDc domain-containing protein n=1 Tax=Catagonus wagneri TaxID=51154 RepID=A0A8C3VT47_9CETA
MFATLNLTFLSLEQAALISAEPSPYSAPSNSENRYRTVEVTPTLTWNEEKSLAKAVSLSLLYKSSVHGSSFETMLNKCSCQASTIIIVYLPNSIFGIFVLEGYPEMSEHFRKPTASFFLSFQKNKTMEITAAFFNSTVKVIGDQLRFNFSQFQYVSLNSSTQNTSIHYLLGEKLGLTSDFQSHYSEYEVFQVEGIKGDTGYHFYRHRNSLLADLRAYRPYADLVSEICILLLGPVGSGKSSFFNSVKPIFRGHLTRQSIMEPDFSSFIEQLRYFIKDGKDGNTLPFILCDLPGLNKKEGGLCIDDISCILKGHIADRYQVWQIIENV